MQVEFTPDQREFVQRAIASGRFRREEDAVEEALSLWEDRERSRIEILAALDESEADLLARRYADYTAESSFQLAEDLKLQAKARRREPLTETPPPASNYSPSDRSDYKSASSHPARLRAPNPATYSPSRSLSLPPSQNCRTEPTTSPPAHWAA